MAGAHFTYGRGSRGGRGYQDSRTASFRHQQADQLSVWSSALSSISEAASAVIAKTSSLFITEVEWQKQRQQPFSSGLFTSSRPSSSPPSWPLSPLYYQPTGHSSYIIPDTRYLGLESDDDEEKEQKKVKDKKVMKKEVTKAEKVESTLKKSVKFSSQQQPTKKTISAKEKTSQAHDGLQSKPKSILKKPSVKPSSVLTSSTPSVCLYPSKPFHYVCLKCYFRAEEIADLLDHLKTNHAHLSGPYLRPVLRPISEVTAGSSPARCFRRGQSGSLSSSSPPSSPPFAGISK